MNDYENEKLARAKKKVEQIKGFYIHFTIYLFFNAALLGYFYLKGTAHGDGFWSFPTFFTPIFWGVGLVCHAVNTFRPFSFLGYKWEQRQIQKFMEEDQREADQYK